MKKIVLTALVTVIMASTAWGKTGDIAGRIYDTDIRTDFYGREINAYNIGGQTVVICEDLGYFGFDVIWNQDKRTLEVDDKYNNPLDEGYARDISLYILPDGYYSRKAPDTIYETDIKTYLNSREIKGYNVGGQTAIVCEDLRNYGYDVEWNADARTLSVSGNGEFNKTPSDLGDVIVTGRLAPDIAESTKKASIRLDNGHNIRGLFASDYNTHYVSLTDVLKEAGAEWTFDGKTITIKPGATAVKLAEDPWLYDNAGGDAGEADKIYLDILCGNNKIDIVYERGGSLLTNGKTYEAGAEAYVCGQTVYIPWYTADKIINS